MLFILEIISGSHADLFKNYLFLSVYQAFLWVFYISNSFKIPLTKCVSFLKYLFFCLMQKFAVCGTLKNFSISVLCRFRLMQHGMLFSMYSPRLENLSTLDKVRPTHSFLCVIFVFWYVLFWTVLFYSLILCSPP